MNKKLIVISIIILLIAIGAIYWGFILQKPVAKNSSQNSAQTKNSVEYVNEQYGFKFSLPQDWQGYSIVTDKWEGYTSDPYAIVEQGPLISIGNPQWTSAKPYQDIPIMVFTPLQWSAMQRNEFHISAAPINLSLFGYNDKYIFGLPARYNFTFPEG